jgi:hypothetical protein
MAKIEQKKSKSSKAIIFPLEKQNYIILAIGLVVIVVGYIALASNGVEGIMPLVVAPILLVLGYCVIIPFGILYKVKEKAIEPTTQS